MLRQLIINGIISGAIYSLVALGFTIIYRIQNFFHFAHGIVYTAGAYLAYSLVTSLGCGLILSFLICSFLAALIGLAINRFVYIPLRRRKSSNLVFVLASFGVFIFLQNLIQIVYGAQIQTLRSSEVKEGHHILGAIITDLQLWIVCISLIVSLVLWIFVQKASIGKKMNAVADDPIAASVIGINPEQTIFWAFFIGSVLAGAAGILISLETNIEPSMGFNIILKGIIASIIGGIGSIPGAWLGGLLLGLIENIGIWKIQAGWKDAIAFGALIIFLLFRPQGIMGKKKERV